MKIIIVGCGKVGQTLAEQLDKEDNDVTVVDLEYELVQDITGQVDVMGVVGNGATREIQKEAGVEKADLLIAVTGSDELNLLCCLIAKKTGKSCQTIARVRNPEYSKEINFIQEELGLAMAINPEYAAAREISKILRFPSAIRIDSFAKGRVEILKCRIQSGSILDGMAISDMDYKLHLGALICVVERGENAIIPRGQFVLQEKDVISIVIPQERSLEFFKKIGIHMNQVKSAMIIGGGNIAYYLAKQLQPMNIKVTLIEKDRKRCEYLSEILPKATIIHGDGSEKNILAEEGINGTEAFIALTDLDEENIMLSLYARSQTKAKLVTKINRISFDEVIKGLDLDTVIYPKNITAEYIVRFVRAMRNSLNSNVETMHRIVNNKVEALEFIINEESAVVGVPLEKLKIKQGILVACINRKGKVITPRGQDEILVGDSVVVITTLNGLNDISDVLMK